MDLSFLQLGSDLKKIKSKIEWCVDGLIPFESVTLLTGRGGIGKTWCMLQLASAVSKGEKFLGLNVKQMPVFYIDFENSLPVIIDRINVAGADKVAFWHSSNTVKPPKLDTLDSARYKELPPGLIIVDTLRASQSQDENDSKAMSLVMCHLKEIRDCGHTVVLLHHIAKGSMSASKGSTAIPDMADQVLNLSEVFLEGDPTRFFRLGTKEKTRYRPFQTFLKFKAEGGFEGIKNEVALRKLERMNRDI